MSRKKRTAHWEMNLQFVFFFLLMCRKRTADWEMKTKFLCEHPFYVIKCYAINTYRAGLRDIRTLISA